MLKRKKSTLLLITIILTILQMAMALFAGIALIFNLFGVVDLLNAILSEMYPGTTIDTYLTTYYIEFALCFLVNMSCLRLYIKGYKYGAIGEFFGKRLIMNGIMQLFFSAVLPGVFAIITGYVLGKKRIPAPVETSTNEAYINEMKLAAMSEAVNRLKELRASGAISEEEYYANINKILES